MFGCVLSALPSKCLLRARAIHCATLPLCTRHPPQVFARISSGRHPTTCAVARVPRRCVSWPRRDRATARCRVAAWTRRVNCGACQEHFVCRCAASPEARLTADTPSQPLGATTLSPAAGQQLALATRRPRLWLRGWRVPRALLRAHAGLCAHSPPRSRTSSAAPRSSTIV